MIYVQEWGKRKTEKKMITFISAILLSLMLMGCGGGTDKILASQEEMNTKIDSLISVFNEPEEAEEPTRKDIITALFDSLVVYTYTSAQIDTDLDAPDHGHVDIRYVEYYSFQLNKSDLYDGEFEFKRHLMAASLRDLQAAKPKYGPSPFVNLDNPEVYNTHGKWRIISEKSIDFVRLGGQYFSFRDFEWKHTGETILGIDIYAHHGHRFMFGSSRGASQLYSVGHMRDLTLIKNGVFDTNR